VRTTKIFLQLFLLMLLAASVFAATPNPGEVQNKIIKKTQIENLQIHITNGGVMLDGTAQLLKDKMKAAEIARKEYAGQNVIDNIKVQPIQKTDAEINFDVINLIRERSTDRFLFSSLSVDTHQGNVFLSGQLLDPVTAKRVVEITSEVPGVQSVTNNIRVLPLSPSDDQLRVRLLSNLASNGVVGGYLNGRHPAISIVVSTGHVTLTGVVKSQLARTEAERVARQTTDVLDVDNRIIVQ
jgi:hyperosmotically inducible periplasmic protein